MVSVLVCFLILTYQWNSVQPLNILGIFPYEGRSHFMLFEKYLLKLAEKGHNLTVISHFPRKEPIPNYHDVNLRGKLKIGESVLPMERSYWTILRVMDYVISSGTVDCQVMLENESVQELWKSKRKFDLVVMQHFNTDCGLGLAHKLEVPVVGITTIELLPWQYRTFGIPFNPSYVPNILSGGYHPTLYERVEKTVLDFLFHYKHSIGQKVDQETWKKYFDDIPPLEELTKNIRFLLLYQNFVLSGSRLLPQNVVEVGGFHVESPKPLSGDLLKFIEESQHGVIYISFGSMLQESSLPKHKMDAILDALAELPQRVIWRWNGDDFPGDKKKIFVSKWLPQNDLLAHPKIVAFLYHAGLLSTNEAIYHSVPLVAMPVFGDQPVNAAGIEEAGFGVKITLRDLTKENLLEKFRTVLDPNFRKRVRELSKAYTDRPIKPMDSAIFWTEYAARHNFTVKNPVADVPLYQYLCLDVLVVLGIFAIVCLLVIVAMLLMVLLLIKRLIKMNVKGKVKIQ